MADLLLALIVGGIPAAHGFIVEHGLRAACFGCPRPVSWRRYSVDQSDADGHIGLRFLVAAFGFYVPPILRREFQVFASFRPRDYIPLIRPNAFFLKKLRLPSGNTPSEMR